MKRRWTRTRPRSRSAAVGGFVAVGARSPCSTTRARRTRRSTTARRRQGRRRPQVRAVSDRDDATPKRSASRSALSRRGPVVAVLNVSGDATARIGNVAVGDTGRGGAPAIQVTADETTDAEQHFAVARRCRAGGRQRRAARSRTSTARRARSPAPTARSAAAACRSRPPERIRTRADAQRQRRRDRIRPRAGPRRQRALDRGVRDRDRQRHHDRARVARQGRVLTNLADTTQVIPQVDSGAALTMSMMVRLAYGRRASHAPQVDGDFASVDDHGQGIGVRTVRTRRRSRSDCPLAA